MFSLFSKSKTIDTSQTELSHVPRDVRSCVSVSASKEYKRERKKSRNRNFRGLFSSDCEDEITSVVSDNPQLYHSHRSCSMSTLGTSTNKSKKHLLMSKKTFDAVEKKMSHIQASLSSSSLMKQNNIPNQQLKEEDTTVMRLKQELEEKEKLAQKLQDQLSAMRAKPLECSSDVDEWEDLLSRKRRQIKKKKEQLRRIEDDGNIDVKISLAEMEYSLEKDQIEMLNLSQKMQSVRVESVKARAVKELAGQESLYRTVETSQTSVLQADRLDRTQLAAVTVRCEGFGLQVGEEAGQRLQPGDRIIEVNGENVLKILGSAWQTMLDQLTCPARVVALRTVKAQQEPHDYKFDVAHVNGLKDDIALIQSRLSEKLQEGRHVSLELAAVQQQRDKLGADNTRLRHRIQYLEDQVTHLEGGMKQVRDSLAQTLNTEIMDTIHKLDKIGRCPESETVFQRGGHVAQVQVMASDSSSTSGVYSVEGSEGSNSPEYNSWRSRTGPSHQPSQRWSVQDFSEQKSQSHVARFVVTADSKAHHPPPATLRSSIDVEDSERTDRSGAVERSASRVTKVSNLMRWPRPKDKDKASANLYVSDTSQV